MKKISHYSSHIKTWAIAHKIAASIIAVVVLASGYGMYKKVFPTVIPPRYIIGTVTTGSISSAITGSGQVAAVNQVDLKSKASGDVVSVNVTNGQTVKAGTLLVTLDSRDALIALQTARLAYQKFTQPADAVSMLQAQNALTDAKNSQATAASDLTKSYDTALTAMSGVFLDSPTILSGLQSMLNSSTGYLSDVSRPFGTLGDSYHDLALKNLAAATNALNNLQAEYKDISYSSKKSDIEKVLDDSYTATRLLAETVKNSKAMADYIHDQDTTRHQSESAAAQSNLTTWINEMSTDLSAITSARNGIQTAKDNVDSSARSVSEKTESLSKVQTGADPLDVQSQALSLQQKEYAYADSFIRAPFDGVVAKISVKKTDSVSSGSSVGTFITPQQVAVISLNEVDAAKVTVGQKATLTFDAIDGLTVQGEVSDVDLVGTVSQGVVTYSVKISFDSQDERVKTGMTVSASITTEAKDGIIVIPNTAIKTRGQTKYVEMLDQSIPATRMGRGGNGSTTPSTTTTNALGVTSTVAPTQRTITTGIVGDLTSEVTSGLSEGEKIVTRTGTGTAATATRSTTPTIFSAAGATNRGGGAAGGGTTRALGR